MALVPTITLVLGAIYTLLPVAWVIIASTKSGRELFSTFTFLPGTGFADNIKQLELWNHPVVIGLLAGVFMSVLVNVILLVVLLTRK